MKEISIPGSKSITNRVLLLASIGNAPVLLKNLLESDDTVYMRNVLGAFGTKFSEQDGGILVTPPTQLKADGGNHFIGNAGTVARFVSAVSLIIEGEYNLNGVDRMHERPQGDLFAALKSLGVSINCEQNDGFLPARYIGKNGVLESNTVTLSGNVSSQFVSALLLVAPLIKKGLTIEMTSVPPSQPYVQMTLEILKIWGVNFTVSDNQKTMTIHPGLTPPKEYIIPADMSGASYPTSWATLLNEGITIKDFGRKTLQGDEGFIDICEQFGASITRSGEDLSLEGGRQPTGSTTLDFSAMPDVAMTGMILSCFYSGTFKFIGLESLRVKECDRIQAMVDGFTQLGITTKIEGDDVTIEGGDYWWQLDNLLQIQARKIETNSHDDHRIAMCFGVLRSALSQRTGVDSEALFSIGEPHCVAKTWPQFWDDLAHWEA